MQLLCELYQVKKLNMNTTVMRMKYMSKAILPTSKQTKPKQLLFKWRRVHTQQLDTFQVATICCFLFIMSTRVAVCGTFVVLLFVETAVFVSCKLDCVREFVVTVTMECPDPDSTPQ